MSFKIITLDKLKVLLNHIRADIPDAQIQSDWNQTDNTAADYIKNKPTGGGHTIWNAIKTALTQRTKLWFADAKVTDDSTEQATKVEVVQLIDDESELTNAPDGVYQGDYDDAPEDVLDASMVAYGEGSVEDALDSLMPGQSESISVTADGVKTYAQLLESLSLLVDLNRITADSRLVFNNHCFYPRNINTTGAVTFFNATAAPSSPYTYVESAVIGTGYCSYRESNPSGSENKSNNVPTSGEVITLYYQSVLKVQEVKEIPSDSVSVTADGVKTYSALLNELYALVDKDRVSGDSYLSTDGYNIPVVYKSSSTIRIVGCMLADVGNTYINGYYLMESNSTLYSWSVKTTGNTVTNSSSSVPTSGTTFTLYYNSYTKVIESCDAEDVSYGSSNVKDALDELTATLGTYTQVTSFPFTLPYNGYIRTYGDGSTQSERWYQCGIGYIALSATSGNDVRYFTKGMTISQKSNGVTMYYYPLNQ